MTLSALIQKDGLRTAATVATTATQDGVLGGTVAKVASVAVANSQNAKTESSEPGGTPGELEAAANRLCDALGDDAERRAIMLDDCREFPPERWPWLVEYLNGEAARIEQAAREAETTDDRRRCADCANFASGGRCLAARRGELSGIVSRRYTPAQPELLRRCEGYAPGLNDLDRRPGAERWPGLTREWWNDGEQE